MQNRTIQQRLDRVASQLSALAREVDLIQRDLGATPVLVNVTAGLPDPFTEPVRRGRRHWTQAENADLTRRYDSNEPIETMATGLGRSIPAVYGQLNKLGLTRKAKA